MSMLRITTTTRQQYKSFLGFSLSYRRVPDAYLVAVYSTVINRICYLLRIQFNLTDFIRCLFDVGGVRGVWQYDERKYRCCWWSGFHWKQHFARFFDRRHVCQFLNNGKLTQSLGSAACHKLKGHLTLPESLESNENV